jgi:hypothetical protein
VKAGPWVFFNGHKAFDFERGLVPEVEGPVGNRLSGRPPLRREADYLLRRMRTILREFDTDLSNAVRVDQFYTMGAAVSAYHLARFAEFGSYIPPSTSIIMERCFTARTNTHTSLIAVVPAEGYAVDKFTLPGQPLSASGYNPAVAASDFVFVAGNMAFRPDGTIDPQVYVAPTRNWGGESAFRRQVHYVITERLEPSLKAAGPRWSTASRPRPIFAELRISPISWTCGRSIFTTYLAPSPWCRRRIMPTRREWSRST